MKILIAEDDTVSRLLLNATLKKLGHEVLAMENGRDAWSAWQEEHFPLLISDWMMPHVDGLELCRLIRAKGRTEYTYIILLTALGGKGSYLAGMEAGADDFITKPFDEEQLSARLRVAKRILDLQAALLESQGALRIQATYDALTGLWNRAAILEAMHLELNRAARKGLDLAVIMADLDHFKQVNDTYGHIAGDAVLREAASRMHRALRPYDQIGRYGGEEFLMIVPECTEEAAMIVANRICRCVSSDAIRVPEGMIRITSSLGVTVNHHGLCTDSNMLIRAADAALYRAKHKGRNRVELVRTAENEQSTRGT